MKSSDYPLVIIGAGAAGLGASEQATAQGIDHIVVEASHRIGGRGLTEYLQGGIAVDLGCHWLHCATSNPYRHWAEQLGFDYERFGPMGGPDAPPYHIHFAGDWLPAGDIKDYEAYIAAAYQSVHDAGKRSMQGAVYDAIDTAGRWGDYFSYWLSLMHSNDIDQVSVRDIIAFHDTGDDWPVRQGYGALIAAQGQNAPVKLNCAVHEIDWRGQGVTLATNNGSIRCDRVLVTVSTGVLAAGQIKFNPVLPKATMDAIDALPLGNSNYQIFRLDDNALSDFKTASVRYQNGDQCMAIWIRPFGTPCVFTSTGGRFAWWLEKQGVAAAKEYFETALVDLFGNALRPQLQEFKVSAWGYDPYIRGAYSSQRPGTDTPRQDLAQILDEKLQFAGEAVSPDQFNTAHGAYLSGRQAAVQMTEDR